MEIDSFFAGFFSGIFLIIFLIGLRLYLAKRANPSFKRIRGYLDLIPSLTIEQREKLGEIRKVFLPKVAQLREELRNKRRVLAGLLFSALIDKMAIAQKMEEVTALQMKLEEEVIDHILEEKMLLNREQQAQFYQIIIDQFRAGGLGVHGVGGRWEKERG
ncbi:MAG: periplasmic heavy metal sensor [Nitrospirota bacterium]|nr:periplasmic heavy metal sensor [Nitrospirota bacterium]MDH5768056.1 periplasmic heavy metal sensor [Nitrospirota bacterium]